MIAVNELTCENVDDLIDSYAAWKLPPGVGGAIRAHVVRCEPCYRRLKVAQAMAELKLSEPGDVQHDSVSSNSADTTGAPHVTKKNSSCFVDSLIKETHICDTATPDGIISAPKASKSEH